jgi:hypothetical protein
MMVSQKKGCFISTDQMELARLKTLAHGKKASSIKIQGLLCLREKTRAI